MNSLFRICSNCGGKINIPPKTHVDLRCQKCGSAVIELPSRMKLRCGICNTIIEADSIFTARHCNSGIFVYYPDDNSHIDISQQRANISCLRCGNRYEAPIGGSPSRITCKACGGHDIVIKFQQERSVKIICACGRESTVLTGEPIKAYHDYPNCKRYELSIFPNSDNFVIENVESRKTLSAIVLCHNLLSVTKTCIDRLRNSSIVPNQIILVDNASTDKTSDWAKIQKDILYIQNRVNLGCAVGRNQGAKWATGDYLLFLDNDQFVSKNSIKKLFDKDEDLVGVEAWKIISNDGYVSRTKVLDDQSYIGAGGMLIKKYIFEALKGFDERYAPAWFEDVDFSFRARLGQYSIDFVNDHGIEHLGNKTSSSQKDFDSSGSKKESQDLFVRIWKQYIDKRIKPVDNIYPFVCKTSLSLSKPKVVLIIDVPDWAWGCKAKQIQKYLSDDFNIEIVTHEQITKGRIKEDYDIYFTFEVNFWRYIAAQRGIRITGVTAHTYQNMTNWKYALDNAEIIHANSSILCNELERLTGREVAYLPNGVDESLFAVSPIGSKFSVGYVGKNNPRKGVSIIRKACEIAGVEFKAQTCRHSDNNKIDHCDMPEFYKSISVICVASDMDGTPNQLLEAAASGRPCIGNRIGNLPEFIKDGDNGFLLDNRDPELYAQKINYLKSNPKKLKMMGRKARKTVESEWTWKLMAENYRKMFWEGLK